jgi:hypothetical protein
VKRLFVCVILSLAAFGSTPAFAEESRINCDQLNSVLSDDKNYYIFTAKASGDSATITGYKFDFGDRQSYTATFPASNQDHHTATVTHTYKDPGSYTIVVHVQTKTQNKSSSVTSDACKTTMQIGEPTLPNTGAGDVITGALGTTIVTFAAHQTLLRYRARRLSL